MNQKIAQQLHQHWANWLKLPAREKNTYTAIVGAIVAALYFALLWPLGHARLNKLEYDMEKQAVREKAAGKAPAQALAPPPSLGGKNLNEARKELDALHQQLSRTEAELAEQRGLFLPLDDTLAMNTLKSGLTGLAEAGDMEVIALEHVYLRSEDKDVPPTPQLLHEAAEHNPFKRPLIVMHARASFRGLMQFLDGLNALPYTAAPVASDISVQIERDPTTKQPIRQWLDVKIHFAI